MWRENSREQILRKLKSTPRFEWKAPQDAPPPFRGGFPVPGNKLTTFEEELTAVGGEVVIKSGLKEIASGIQEVLTSEGISVACCVDSHLSNSLAVEGIITNNDLSLPVAITPCEFLVARSGSVVVASSYNPAQKAHVAARVHVVVARASSVKDFLADAIDDLKKLYPELPPWVGIITGPSRTADIEKTLVTGVHGPKRLIVFIDKES